MPVLSWVPRTAAILLISAAGCATSTGGMAISNVPLSGRPYEVVGQAQTTLQWWSVDLGIYSGPFEPPPVDAAMKKLLAKHNGEALLNIRFSVDQFLFPILALHRLHMKADVIRFGSPTDESKRR